MKMERLWSVPTGTNRGVEELAKWMIDHPAELDRLLMWIGRDIIDRILCGDVIPDDEEAEIIGQITGGTVRQAMFSEPGLIPGDDGDVGGAHLECGACEAAVVAATAKGLLGETPAGPLWAAMEDDGAVEIHGLGIAMRLGMPAAIALHFALSKAISPAVSRA